VAVERLPTKGDAEAAARLRCARRAAAQALGLDPAREGTDLVAREAGGELFLVVRPETPPDCLLARTDREGDVVVAVCFAERSP
jgi:hypothetical protein